VATKSPRKTTRAVDESAGASTNQPQVDVIMVRSVPVSIRRCGFRFSQEPYGIVISGLTDEQLERLENDPDLVTERGTIDAPTAAELGAAAETATEA